MQLSISQISKYLECPRRWWFDRVVRLPSDGQDTKGKYSRAFGSILHAVVERFLDADASGRGKDGQPVNLYPKGWMWDQETGIRLTPDDEKIVQTLVAQAIDRGILARQPGGVVEDEFFGILYQDPNAPEYRGVVAISGKIDYQYGTTIEDHKTAKSTRYLKSEDEQSPKYLGKDPQLLLYALVAGRRLGLTITDEMTIRHNYYVKEPEPRVEERHVTVTMKQCWEAVQGLAKESKKILPLAKKKNADLWATVPGALDGAGQGPSACNSYGTQCPYIGICSRSETPTKYRLRMLRLKHPDALADTTEDSMAALSLKDKIAAQRAKQAKAAPAAKAPAKPAAKAPVKKAAAKPAPAPEPEPEAEEEETVEVELEETPEEEAQAEEETSEETQDVEMSAVDAGQVARDVLIGLRDALLAQFPVE